MDTGQYAPGEKRVCPEMQDNSPFSFSTSIKPVTWASRSDTGTKVPTLLAWSSSVLRMKVTGAASTNGAADRANPATNPAK